MKFNVRGICGKYTEMSVDEIETGTLDNDEAAALAGDMIAAAAELLAHIDMDSASDACIKIIEDNGI